MFVLIDVRYGGHIYIYTCIYHTRRRIPCCSPSPSTKTTKQPFGTSYMVNGSYCHTCSKWTAASIANILPEALTSGTRFDRWLWHSAATTFFHGSLTRISWFVWALGLRVMFQVMCSSCYIPHDRSHWQYAIYIYILSLLCIFIYVWLCSYVHTMYAYICVHIVYICIHIYMCIHTAHINTNIYIYIYVYIYKCNVCISVCVLKGEKERQQK